MSKNLISEIDDFLRDSGLSEYRFGFLAASNGRLVERLRGSGRIWPETEGKVRRFLANERKRRGLPKNQEAAQ